MTMTRCQDKSWYPGKPRTKPGGRPPIYTEHQKDEIARVAMDLKRKIAAPTPRRVRARLPSACRRPDTGTVMSNRSIRRIFTSRCFDEHEDDPWQWLASLSQDMLPEKLKPRRVECAKHILRITSANSWYSHVSIDPCSSLLPKTEARKEEMQIAAMGKMKWMSKGSARKGINLRAPDTAKKPGGSDVFQVHWTPVFARGKLRLFVCDPSRAGDQYPSRLNDSANISLFAQHILPSVLEEMRRKYKWLALFLI